MGQFTEKEDLSTEVFK